MMTDLAIEWRHPVQTETELRCSETGKTLFQVVADLTREMAEQGIPVSFQEIKGTGDKAAGEFNELYFNGTPLESLIRPAGCCGGACKTDPDNYWRAFIYENGNFYVEIPEAVIRQAAFQAVGLSQNGCGNCKHDCCVNRSSFL